MVRLIGVGIENLQNSPSPSPPGGLFNELEQPRPDGKAEKLEKIERASDNIIARLGAGAVFRGSRLPDKNP